MSATAPTFSVFLPQVGLPWTTLRERSQQIEALGYEGLWLVDHFFAQAAPGLDHLEGWTALAGLAEATERVRLGLMVNCNSFRSPALVAKMAATLDHISNGRAELGMGAGWMEEEYDAYGYDFPSVGTRLSELGEGLEIIDRLMTCQASASFEGKHYRLNEAPFAPKAVQEKIPITIGGAGEKVLLRLVARYADRWNCPMNPALEIERLRGVLATHCETEGRDPDEIIVSEQTVVVIGADEVDLKKKRAEAEALAGSFADLDLVAVEGTPPKVIEELQAKMERGVRDFALVFGDFGQPDTLETFAETVMKPMRAG